MAIPIKKARQHAPGVVGAESFSKMKKNSSLHIGSTHGEMFREFLKKFKLKDDPICGREKP